MDDMLVVNVSAVSLVVNFCDNLEINFDDH